MLSNVGTIAAFTTGPEDADILGRHLDRDIAAFNPMALMTQPPFHAYARRPGSDTYSTTVEPPDPVTRDRQLVVIEQSRMRFARSITSVS